MRADARTAVEELAEAQQYQERMQGELKDVQVCLDNGFAEFKEVNHNLEDAGKRIVETSAESRRCSRQYQKSSGSMSTTDGGA